MSKQPSSRAAALTMAAELCGPVSALGAVLTGICVGSTKAWLAV